VKQNYCAAADKNIVRQLFYTDQKYLNIVCTIVRESAGNSLWEA